MSVDQDVERSLLERKDRADLVAMATALGEKPPARAKKADIIELILRLTQVGDPSSKKDATPAAAPPATAPGSNRSPSGRSAAGLLDRPDAGSAPTPPDTGAESVAKDAAHGNAEPVAKDAPARSDTDADTDTGRQADNDEIPPDRASTDDGPRPDGASGPRPGREQSGQGAGRDAQGGGRPNNQQGAGGGQRDNQSGGRGDQGGNQRDNQPNGNQQQQGGNNRQGAGNQQQQGGNDQNRGGQQGVKVDEGEPGNRRRRRRGRDRERQAGELDEAFVGEPVDVEGLLDLRDEGYGFLRLKGYLPSKDDVYVSVKQARQFSLRKGDRLRGKSRPASRNEKNPALLQIESVNGVDPDRARQRSKFEDLTPLFPDEKLRLEVADDPTNMTARIVDLIAPIGKGQRGLIVSPPKAGKTTVMKQVARSIELNNPEVNLIVLLVDERPEEVTDMKRWLRRGEVAASTFDRPSDEHTAVAELVIERAKRMVEEGQDVVIILDGITRLARAYNLAAPATGRIMSGGIDTGALYPPKKFFGAARNVEEGGSLTILATALVETGSRMDEVIFEEFKGTGNMELKLDRRLADRRIYPAIDVDASSTRHEELLFERKQLQQVWRLRRVLSGLGGEGASSAAGLELLIDRMKTFKSNDEFLAEVAKAPSV